MTRLFPIIAVLLSLSAPAQDSLICFTRAEAEQIHDTVWSAVNHRRARIIMAAMIGNLEQQLASALVREEAERNRADRNAQELAPALTTVEQLTKDAAFWKRKAKGRGLRGFFAGLVLGGAAGYGTNELMP
jgi:hypothetical protein